MNCSADSAEVGFPFAWRVSRPVVLILIFLRSSLVPVAGDLQGPGQYGSAASRVRGTMSRAAFAGYERCGVWVGSAAGGDVQQRSRLDFASGWIGLKMPN